jgi:hypothetical protein
VTQGRGEQGPVRASQAVFDVLLQQRRDEPAEQRGAHFSSLSGLEVIAGFRGDEGRGLVTEYMLIAQQTSLAGAGAAAIR